MPNPQEVLSGAKPGDTVKVYLRGPASEEEVNELRTVYEENYPGVKFEFEDNAVVSAAEIVGHNG